MLTANQRDTIASVTRFLPVEVRTEVLQGVTNIIDGGPTDDGAVHRAIRMMMERLVQERRWTPPKPEKPAVHHRRQVGTALP
jgi:hypothetical protein